jgi:hypothetical protein
MQSQLNYILAKQHQAELIQRAERARVGANINGQRSRRRSPRVSMASRIRVRIASRRAAALAPNRTHHVA